MLVILLALQMLMQAFLAAETASTPGQEGSAAPTLFIRQRRWVLSRGQLYSRLKRKSTYGRLLAISERRGKDSKDKKKESSDSKNKNSDFTNLWLSNG